MKKNKKIIVYDKWLETLGGGEVVACAIAEAFEKNNEVKLVSKNKIAKKEIEEKLGFKLKSTNLNIINENKIIKNCDVFINSTYLDLTFVDGAENYLYVHFPHKIEKNVLLDFVKQKISSYLKENILLFETNKQSSIEYINGRKSQKIENEDSIKFNNLDNHACYLIKLFIYIKPVTKNSFEKINFYINNKKIEPKRITYDHWNDVLKIEFLQFPKDKKINLSFTTNDSNSEYFLIDVTIIKKKLKNILLLILKKRIEQHLRKGYFPSATNQLKKYRKIFCNSNFTKKWIKKYWKIEAKTIYPPITFVRFNESEFSKKNNWICSVGRFFKNGHNKKQEVMIECFKKLYDSGLKNIELHLVGGIDSSEETKKYVNYLLKIAYGYPIKLHINASREKVEKIYKKSKIYWHATGINTNRLLNPIKLEHFGISSIEAISAGCYPILFNAGGLPETIYNLSLSKKKHIFNSKYELKRQTIEAINNYQDWQKNWQKLFYKIREIYSKEKFKKDLIEAIN